VLRRAKHAWRILAKDDLAVDEAKKEIQSKTGEEVDRETAFKWAARAIASYEVCTTETSLRKRVERFTEGDDYRHEALEHAGTSGSVETLTRVARETASARKKALETFEEEE
jgi:hypothetical protein